MDPVSPPDPFDPDHPPPHWVDAEAVFAGWLSAVEAGMAAQALDETLADQELADLLAASDATDDEF